MIQSSQNPFSAFAQKMRDAQVSDSAIRAFQHNYEQLLAGQSGLISESTIQPVPELPRLESIAQQYQANPALLPQTAIVKLNGGLGTSMGLERAKSLLQVKNGLTFLDFIVKQVLYLRRQHQVPLTFLLMNSFSTSEDTLRFLRKYPELGSPESLEFLQSQVPKVDAQNMAPASWPENPHLEWCPPGHGDLYPSLLASGSLARLLASGVRYLFVSNSDNLGASLDLNLLSYFAASGKPFLMEVAVRTASDRKGGHLAQRDGKLLLRESAQTPEADLPAFQDIQRHRFFNTNNLWVQLEQLQNVLDANGGFVPLPMIKNAKTVDPRKKNSPAVFQLETAMGAAIESFANSGAVVVPRSRFAPVKTTSDLLALRSDAYEVTADWRVVLDQEHLTQPPKIDLDSAHYKLVEQLDDKLAGGIPSIRACHELTIQGPVRFNSGNVFAGKVTIRNPASEARALPAGEYRDCVKQI